MRIGIFSDTYPPFVNGVSTSISVLKKYLEKLGHQVYVVTVNNEKFIVCTIVTALRFWSFSQA